MSKFSTDRLYNLISPAVEALGFELVGCELVSDGGHSGLRVYIDSEQGINIDDCTRVSRQISAVLDVEDPIFGKYNLEVSSPGFNRLLVKLEHYQRFIGWRVKIKLIHPQSGRRHFTGELLACDTQGVSVRVDGETFYLRLADIEKANLAPEY